MRPHQVVGANLVGIFVFTIAVVIRIFERTLPGLTEAECGLAPPEWCTPAVRSFRTRRSCDLAGKSKPASAVLKCTVVGVSQSAAAVLDSAGVDPSALLNSTAGGGSGDSGVDSEAEGEDGSSFRSYFNVFSDAENSGPYSGWAHEAHGINAAPAR
eukprot:COSAG03_NODE_4140_length_1667_cov_683.268495_2_plen_156_part_00